MNHLAITRLVSAGVYVRTMVVFSLAWWGIAAWTGNPMLLPGPERVATAIIAVAADGDLFLHAAISLTRLAASLAIAAAIAVPLGLAMGTSEMLEHIVDPVVEILRPISGIAWIPLALFIFGIGHGLPIFIMAYTAAFPILVGTVAGAKFVDRRLVDAARVMGLDRATIIRRVVVPAALPSILVSLRLGVASGWTAVIAAELVGAPNGLGYAISWYREMLVTPKVIAFIAMVGVSGYVCDLLLRHAARRLTPWAPAEATAR
ncbi:MAG: ABC transporter permease [Proteobacteria bacterium]|nr:ABC transporter permease [Pseudomonadota bacterium]